VPYYARGRPDYTLKPRAIIVSERSAWHDKYVHKHDAFVRAQVERFLVEEVGVTLDQVRDEVSARWRTCIIFLRGLGRATGTEMFFVTSHVQSMRDTLLDAGAHTHLLSYFNLRTRRSVTLEPYVSGSNFAKRSA
jgi:hypothetical protein